MSIWVDTFDYIGGASLILDWIEFVFVSYRLFREWIRSFF